MTTAIRRVSALDEIRALSILDVASRIGITRSGRGSIRCPFPDHPDINPSFCFNRKTNRWRCYGCGRAGDSIDLVALIQRWSMRDAILWLRQSYNLGAPRISHSKFAAKVSAPLITESVVSAPASEFVANPEIYEALLADHPLREEAVMYLSDRGFSRATMSHFRLGFLGDTKAAIQQIIRRFGLAAVRQAGLLKRDARGMSTIFPSPSVLFPFIERGRIVYLQTRILPGYEGPRWMAPRGIEKPIYNLEALAGSREIYICEGATDVLSAHELDLAAIGLPGAGSHFPTNVFRALRGRTVYIVPDNDKAGMDMRTRLTTDFRRAGIQSVTKSLPVGKDLNEYLRHTRKSK
ncbi:MAG: Zinc finger, CHC2-family protein [Rhodospirillales bacterium]|nr:Zinc finger, CHC2-family protein [Rhodospirillales bacterium]